MYINIHSESGACFADRSGHSYVKHAVLGTTFPMCGQLETHPRPTGHCKIMPSSQRDINSKSQIHTSIRQKKVTRALFA